MRKTTTMWIAIVYDGSRNIPVVVRALTDDWIGQSSELPETIAKKCLELGWQEADLVALIDVLPYHGQELVIPSVRVPLSGPEFYEPENMPEIWID